MVFMARVTRSGTVAGLIDWRVPGSTMSEPGTLEHDCSVGMFSNRRLDPRGFGKQHHHSL